MLANYTRPKYMTPNNPDYEDAHKALKIVGDATNHVNKMMGQTKNFKELLALQERLGNFRLRIKPNQSLVKEGTVKIQTLHKGLQPKYIILLSDILITGKDFKSIKAHFLKQSSSLKSPGGQQ